MIDISRLIYEGVKFVLDIKKPLLVEQERLSIFLKTILHVIHWALDLRHVA